MLLQWDFGLSGDFVLKVIWINFLNLSAQPFIKGLLKTRYANEKHIKNAWARGTNNCFSYKNILDVFIWNMQNREVFLPHAFYKAVNH